MLFLDQPKTFDDFRITCRKLLQNGIKPHEVKFDSDNISLFESQFSEQHSLINSCTEEFPNSNTRLFQEIRIKKDHLKLLETLSLHRSNDIWDLLYRLLCNSQIKGPSHLLNAADPDVIDAMRRLKQISRDIHKMHAFVRFRKVGMTETGIEQFLAWHKPEHKIIRQGAVFFKKRFPHMNWSILSPDESAHWDGTKLTYSEGVHKDPLDNTDNFESWWLTYYEAIFNPARVNIKAMKNEMPTKYWESIPETKIIAKLLKDAPMRVEEMKQRALELTIPKVRGTYDELKRDCSTCTNCQISCLGGKAVFGEGSLKSKIMVVGEQTGDEEDIAGKVFIGPAGRLLNELFNKAEISRENIYITNAVKHFKWEQKGEKRIHKTPTGLEILSCRNWLEAEIELVKPEIIICLGRIAAQSVLGIQLKISDCTLTTYKGPSNSTVLVTYHPSSILRAQSISEKNNQKEKFISTLRLAKQVL